MSCSKAVIQRSGRTTKWSFSVAVIIIVSTMIACSSQAPQRPSQRSGETAAPDSALILQVEMNRMLAQAADAELVEYIRNHPGRWFSQDDGAWVQEGESKVESQKLKVEESVALHMVVKDLKGNMLLDEQKQYRLGHCELPEAVEHYLTAQRSYSDSGLSAQRSILAPYYVAYGSQGAGNIPPYTNVVIEIEIR